MTPRTSSACPSCGWTLDSQVDVERKNRQPVLGSVVICLSCEAVLEYGVGMVLQAASDSTLANVAGYKPFMDALSVVAKISPRGEPMEKQVDRLPRS